MKIDVTRFCGLSRREDFQQWLKSVSNAYYDELIYFLRLGKSCGDNKTKMEEIYQKLVNDKKSDSMTEFLAKNYPHMLIYDKNDAIKNEAVKKEIAASAPVIQKINISLEEQNFHKVFQIYKPGILLLPHQMIFIDKDKRLLENRIIEFIRMKIQTDYLILEGPNFFHGYIEYFEKRFATEATKFKNDNRPIFTYKRKNHLT
jgi:hypothetical protein